MAINFPSSTNFTATDIGTLYTYPPVDGKTWEWNGTAWDKASSTETGNTEGNTGEVAYYSGKGSIIAGATNLLYSGVKGDPEILDVRGGITASGGLYTAGGATFAGDVNFLGNIGLKTGNTIKDQSNNPIFEVVGDRRIEIGDTDSSGSSTKITIRDTHQLISLDADIISLGAAVVNVDGEIKCTTDSDTKIAFYGSGGNQIDFMAQGKTFGGSIKHSSGAYQMLHAPFGITVGNAVGGALGAGNIYTPYGVTCGQLEVGGYWAGEQSDYVGIAIDNGTSVITTGKKAHRIIPWDCEVIEWTISSADSGLIQWDINWCTYSDWPSTASVGGSALPGIALVVGPKNQDTSVNWAKTTFAAGDIIEFEVDSVTSLTNCILSIKIRRTS